MRWNFNDFDHPPELSSDIEWMIQSGQVSRELILETLVTQYHPTVYQLAISLLNDRFAARTVTRETFIHLLLHLHQYRSPVGVKNWVSRTVYQLYLTRRRGEGVWKYLEKLISVPGQFTDPVNAQPPTDTDRLLWQRLDGLDDADRTLLILRYRNEWDISEISLATRMDEETVNTRLCSSLKSVMGLPEISLDEANYALKKSLSLRWQSVEASEEEIGQFIKQVSQRAIRKHSLRNEISTVREMVLLGLALLFVILIIWGGNRFLL
jgi:RNA polymerase sigma factor (sigma-70 family)